MRKRTYTPLAGRGGLSDVLVEDIDAYYVYLSSTRSAAAGAPPPARPAAPQSVVHNLVGTSMVEKRFRILDLRTISRLLPNCVYDQQKFAAITLRIHRPSCTVLLFTSGKMVLTGCRSYISSGKIVITGGKSVFDVSDGWKALWPTVQRYICARADTSRPAVRAL